MRRLNVVVAGSLVLAGVAMLPIWRPVDPATGAPVAALTDAPPGVTAALRDLTGPGDRVFNPQAWGSWFEFALPEVKVALDSRIEFFPVDVWDAYDTVVTGRAGWESRLASWGVTVVVAEDPDGPFAARLAAAGWERAYVDEDGAIFRGVP
jgi:hypothetical protein